MKRIHATINMHYLLHHWQHLRVPYGAPLQNTILRIIAACAAILFLPACVGQSFKTDNIARITNGKTTRTEIEAWFRKPFKSESLTNGPKGAVTRYTWVSGHMIPLGANSRALVVDFDANGVVVDHAYNQQTRILTNIVPGAPAVKVAESDHPR